MPRRGPLYSAFYAFRLRTIEQVTLPKPKCSHRPASRLEKKMSATRQVGLVDRRFCNGFTMGSFLGTPEFHRALDETEQGVRSGCLERLPGLETPCECASFGREIQDNFRWRCCRRSIRNRTLAP